MALVAYLDWEVRTTGHDLNCSAFNPARDTTSGVDYTQQDNAEITSMAWRVDASNNTWIRSTELTNWVNSGKTLASLKGNHIHIAGMAIAGGVLFDWVASTGKPGAYYLQAKGGGNPSWTTKPTRVWLNKVYTPENTNLPSGSNTWAWGDWDSLGYNTIYVRFGAESDVNPSSKNQDDVIADGRVWSRGAYEIINVGTDANGPYLVLDRSPAAVNSQDGYGRVGGAMASPGGACSIFQTSSTSLYMYIWVSPGTYEVFHPTLGSYTAQPSGAIDYFNACPSIIGKGDQKWQKPSTLPTFLCHVPLPSNANGNPLWIWCDFRINYSSGGNYRIVESRLTCEYEASGGITVSGFASYIDAFGRYVGGGLLYCYVRRTRMGSMQNLAYHTIFADGYLGQYLAANGWSGFAHINCVFYNTPGTGLYCGGGYNGSATINCVAMNCANGFTAHSQYAGYFNNNYAYACTNPAPNRPDFPITILTTNPFRDPANGDFRLADNEAGRMLKQAGFQIPGPQGAPPMKFDVGAVQNSFYDLASGGIPGLPPMIFGG